MSYRNPWSRHYQNVWQERAGDARLPAWLRIASLAYGSHAANGHAQFKAGEIGLVLGSVDRVSGVITPMHKSNVQRALNKAIEYGWLGQTSRSTCLVVPGHAVVGGMGKASDECPQNHRTRTGCHSVTHLKAAGKSLSDNPVSHSVTTQDALTCTDATALYESSHPQPDTPTQPQELSA